MSLQQKELFGKPNILINHLGIEYGTYVNRPSQGKVSMDELVELSERFVELPQGSNESAESGRADQKDTYSRLKRLYHL